jgi:hypothetical protein
VSEIGVRESEYIKSEGLQNIEKGLNGFIRVEYYISLKDYDPVQPPEFLPDNVKVAFIEGTKCQAIGCFNAAGAMFRLSIDLATKSMLPEGDSNGLNSKIRRNLGLRLPWLFENKLLPEALRELSNCIKEDGNDGAHEGTLSKPDAEDMVDFSFALFERIYTEPERLRLAKLRRDERRG